MLQPNLKFDWFYNRLSFKNWSTELKYFLWKEGVSKVANKKYANESHLLLLLPQFGTGLTGGHTQKAT